MDGVDHSFLHCEIGLQEKQEMRLVVHRVHKEPTAGYRGHGVDVSGKGWLPSCLDNEVIISIGTIYAPKSDAGGLDLEALVVTEFRSLSLF